jgi:hypothetical protein
MVTGLCLALVAALIIYIKAAENPPVEETIKSHPSAQLYFSYCNSFPM